MTLKIANPIYDVVFKFMLTDKQVAKLLLSAIIDEEIVELEFQPTELQIPLHEAITVLRMDFKATVRYKDGTQRVIIIEIQKAKLPTDIMRFRRYLGQQYGDKNNSIVTQTVTTEKGEVLEHREAIPLLSIYFLGHKLDHAKNVPVIKVNRNYIDVATKKVLPKKEAFIESLTHDSFIIQIPYIKGHRRTELERMLHIFDQSKAIKVNGSYHFINIKEEDIPEQYRPIVRRLLAALSSEDIRNHMFAEDELLNELQFLARQIRQKDKALKQKDKALEQRDKALEQKDKALQQKDIVLEQKEKALGNAIKKLLAIGLSPPDIAVTLDVTIEEVDRIANI